MPLTSSICSGSRRTLGARSVEGRAPAEHSRLSSLWVLGPQPTAGPTGATAPSLALLMCGQTAGTPCSCLSQVRTLVLAQLSCCSSVAILCPTLFDPLDCSTTDSSVLHCLLMGHSLVLVKGLVLLNEDMSHVMHSHPRQTSHSEEF